MHRLEQTKQTNQQKITQIFKIKIEEDRTFLNDSRKHGVFPKARIVIGC